MKTENSIKFIFWYHFNCINENFIMIYFVIIFFVFIIIFNELLIFIKIRKIRNRNLEELKQNFNKDKTFMNVIIGIFDFMNKDLK